MRGYKIFFVQNYGKLSLLPLLIWSFVTSESVILLCIKTEYPLMDVVVLLFYVHGKHLRSCWDGQLT